MGNANSTEDFHPNYSILEDPSYHKVFINAMEAGKGFLLCKEELGNNYQKGEYLYDVCPTPSSHATVRPVFLIRDPIRIFDSWKSVG